MWNRISKMLANFLFLFVLFFLNTLRNRLTLIHRVDKTNTKQMEKWKYNLTITLIRRARYLFDINY